MAPLLLSLPTASSIQVVRSFQAPRRLVWRAFTEPELVKQWLTGPSEHSMPECEIDFRVGGSWRYVWEWPDGRMTAVGTYKQIDDLERIVHTEAFDIAPEMESLVETAFAERDGMTIVTMQMHYASEDARDAVIASGMEDGLEASYVNLDRLTEKLTLASSV